MSPLGPAAERLIVYRYRLAPMPGVEYVSASCRSLIGYSPAEIYADPLLSFKLVHPDDVGLLASRIQSPAALMQPVVLRWRRRDGSPLWTEMHNHPIYDDAGTLVAVDGVALDVTRRETSRHTLVVVPRAGGGAAGDLLSGTLEELGPIVVVRMEGEVDISTVPTFEAYLRQATARGRPIVVDLSGVEYFDATGIRALEAAAAECAVQGVALVTVPSRMVQRVLSLVGVDRHIATAESVAAAMRRLSEPS